MTKSEHELLCLFTSVQMLRTNNTREFIEGFNEIISEDIKDRDVGQNSGFEGFLDVSKEDVKNSSISILNSMPGEIAGNFINKELTLLRAPSKCFFYISDHPVTKHNHFPREHRGNLGIALYGIEIYFPISPKYCLSFICSEVASEIKQTVMNHKAATMLGVTKLQDISEAELMVKCFENKTPNQMLPINMDFNNSNQVISSTRFIYSASDDFSLALDMLKTHPEIATQPKVVNGSIVF